MVVRAVVSSESTVFRVRMDRRELSSGEDGLTGEERSKLCPSPASTRWPEMGRRSRDELRRPRSLPELVIRRQPDCCSVQHFSFCFMQDCHILKHFLVQ